MLHLYSNMITNKQRIKFKLINRIENEQLWGFDTIREALHAILTHEDYAIRWDVSLNTKFLADAYKKTVEGA